MNMTVNGKLSDEREVIVLVGTQNHRPPSLSLCHPLNHETTQFQLVCDNREVEVDVDIINGTVRLYGTKLRQKDFCMSFAGKTALVCEEAIRKAEEAEELSHMHLAFYVITSLVLLSTVSLLVTLLIHMIIPELRRPMFGKMKLCHLVSLFFAYLALLSGLVAGGNLHRDFSIACQVVAFATQFFFLSSFFWVTVMSHDVWRTFHQIRRFRTVRERGPQKMCRLYSYASYAWGLPSLLVAVTIAMQVLPGHITEGCVKPDVGVHSCFFGSNWSKLVYFHFPIAFLLLTNIIFFLMSSWSLLFGIWAPTANFRLQRRAKRRFLTVIELFFVLGLSWTAEIVSEAISWKTGTHRIWWQTLPFDILNASQGFIILLFLLLKPRVIRLMIPIQRHFVSITSSFRKSSLESS